MSKYNVTRLNEGAVPHKYDIDDVVFGLNRKYEDYGVEFFVRKDKDSGKPYIGINLAATGTMTPDEALAYSDKIKEMVADCQNIPQVNESIKSDRINTEITNDWVIDEHNSRVVELDDSDNTTVGLGKDILDSFKKYDLEVPSRLETDLLKFGPKQAVKFIGGSDWPETFEEGHYSVEPVSNYEYIKLLAGAQPASRWGDMGYTWRYSDVKYLCNFLSIPLTNFIIENKSELSSEGQITEEYDGPIYDFKSSVNVKLPMVNLPFYQDDKGWFRVEDRIMNGIEADVQKAVADAFKTNSEKYHKFDSEKLVVGGHRLIRVPNIMILDEE